MKSVNMVVFNYFFEDKKIIVVGGGIVGCVFVVVFYKFWNLNWRLLEIVVFECNLRDV